MKNYPLALFFIIAALVGLVALSFIVNGHGPGGAPDDRPRFSPHSYSTSAIGHAGFYETLRLMGRPVKRGLSDSLVLAGENGTVLLLEPNFNEFDGEYGDELFFMAPRLLIVLPKWQGSPYPPKPDWVEQLSLNPQGAKNILKLIKDKAGLRYQLSLNPQGAKNILNLIKGKAGLRYQPWPETWENNEFAYSPTGRGEVQLIVSSDMVPLLGTAGGILLGELSREDEQKIWVLADPDVLSNQGLGLGDNAALMVSVIDQLRMSGNSDPRAPLIIDELIHGLKPVDNSVWAMLFRFPYVIVAILAAVSALMLVLAGAGRFGPPLTPKEELDFGKASLIANSVRFLDFAGHHREILKNYIWVVIRLTARDLHAPRGKGDQAVLDWLDRLGQARGVSSSCSAIVSAVDMAYKSKKNADQLYKCARDIHRWKGEMLNGPHSSRSHS